MKGLSVCHEVQPQHLCDAEKQQLQLTCFRGSSRNLMSIACIKVCLDTYLGPQDKEKVLIDLICLWCGLL